MIGNDPTGASKLDSAASDGLNGKEDSISYRIAEIERHHHNTEKWFGAAVTPVGETHIADRMAVCAAAFELIAGADDFGDWVQVLGSDDAPVTAGAVKFDAHRILVSDTNSTNPFIIEVVSGESVDIAAKIAAEQFSEAPYISASNNNDSGVEDVKVRRTAVGEKVWARCRCIGSSGSILHFFFGIHEYEG